MANVVIASGNDATNITYPSTADYGVDWYINANAGYYFASLPIVTATNIVGQEITASVTLNNDSTIATVYITSYVPLTLITIDGLNVLPSTQPIPTQAGLYIPYVVNKSKMQALSQLIFDSTAADLNEYILSLREYYFPLEVTNDVEIRLGNLRTGVSAGISLLTTYTIDFGNATIPDTNNNINDYNNRNISIVLPFLGKQDLDASTYTGQTVNLKYDIDIITGLGIATLSIDDIGIDFYSGKIGKDMPYKTSQINGLQGVIDTEQQPLYPLQPYILITYRKNTTGADNTITNINDYVQLSQLQGFNSFASVQMDSQIPHNLQAEIQQLLQLGVYF